MLNIQISTRTDNCNKKKVRKIVATKKRFTENWFEVLKPYISYYTYVKKLISK